MFISKHKKSIWISAGFCSGSISEPWCISCFFRDAGAGRTAERVSYNLMPFREISRFLIYREQLGFTRGIPESAGNILIFMPFGFLLPIMSRKLRGFFRVAFLGFELSLAVEILQLVSKTGSCDVDDMILIPWGDERIPDLCSHTA